MVKLLPVIDNIGFILDEDGSYIGYATNRGEELIKLEFKDHFLICTEEKTVLFSLRYEFLSVNVLLCVLQDYGIINMDYK